MSGLGEVRILVVDDNAQMREIMAAVLTAAGVRRLTFAPDAKTGLERLRSLQVDVIYVDYEMPRMNGLDFIAAVRALPGDQGMTPIIMLTGHADVAHLNAARDRGVNEFLAKPVTARNILARLESVIYRPRNFVKCTTYFGPDRRRRAHPNYSGPLRRSEDNPAMLEL